MHKYSVSSMCKILSISRAGFYKYEEKENRKDEHTDLVHHIFRDSRRSYGTRRIKAECLEKGIVISRRRIGRIMRSEGLSSVYTVKKYRVAVSSCNEATIENKVDREFNNRARNEVIVSDLTYVKVKNQWNYICTIIDLHNREIIGYSVGPNKTAQLVYEAFVSIERKLTCFESFHTDRGKEFDNKLIEEVLETFGIERSLSLKGSPHDNAVAEATNKSLKTEFVYQRRFRSTEQLKKEFGAYVWWYNHKRLHSTLNYQTPIDYAKQQLAL